MRLKSRGFATPSHSYVDDMPYFITAATYKHQRLLNDEVKTLLRDLLRQVFTEYGWRLEHWVILDNHYHLMATSRLGKDLPKIIAKIHNLTAQAVNRLFPPSERADPRVWYNYWDYCPRNEKDYDVRLCYLLNNPFKHGYVEDLRDWPWSSFSELYQRDEDEEMRRLFRKNREYRELVLAEDDY